MKEKEQTNSQEQRAGKILSEEAMRQAIQSLLDGEEPLDTDPFEWELKDIPERFKKN